MTTWMKLYNRAPGPLGRVAVLFAAGFVGTVGDLISATADLFERGRQSAAVSSPSTDGDERG